MGRIRTFSRLGCCLFLVFFLRSTPLTHADPPPSVKISPTSKIFTDTIRVTLDRPAGSSVFYTTDGTAPSPANGTKYLKPFLIKRTTTVRAVAIKAKESSTLTTESYVRISKELAAHKSHLPIMLIDTASAGAIPGKGWHQMGLGIKQVPRQPAIWMLFDREVEGQSVTLKKDPQLASRIGIRQRGSFSSSWKQKPYSVEAWDGLDQDRDVSPLGLPAESDWTLYYPDPGGQKDRTLIYNAFMWRLSAKAGRYAPRFRWVEAFINEDGGDLALSDRRGIYAVVEKVKRGKHRVPFDKLAEDGKTGGWLLSINRIDPEPAKGWPTPNGATSPQFFHTAGPDRRLDTPPNAFGRGDDIPRLNRAVLNFENPSGSKINPQQRTAIEGWFKEFEDVLYDDSRWLDAKNGYRSYIDSQDFIDFFIFNNLAQNYDGLLLSIYPWRSSKDGKLRLGPTWDFNFGCYNQSGSISKSAMNQSQVLWFGRLFEDPAFMQQYVDRWQILRKGALSNASITEVVNALVSEIGDENAVAQGISTSAQWRQRISSMHTWLHSRADWLDSQGPKPPIFSETKAEVPKNTPLFLRTGSGRILYTLDGSDPRAPSGKPNPKAQIAAAPSFQPLVQPGAPARVLVPENESLGKTWTAPDFNDQRWLKGKTGIGYDEKSTYKRLIRTDLLKEMAGKRTSAYIRIPFTITRPLSNLSTLRLTMACDDGYIAYLNGERVATENAPAKPSFSSRSLANAQDTTALSPPTLDLTEHLATLRQGANILAIHGLNANPPSSDFLILPSLDAGTFEPNQAIKLTKTVTVTARTYDRGAWSQSVTRRFTVTP